METIYRELAQFMAETIEDYELCCQLALKKIGRNRCSLQQADNSLYNQMYDATEEYIIDNELDIEIDEIDIETIFFN